MPAATTAALARKRLNQNARREELRCSSRSKHAPHLPDASQDMEVLFACNRTRGSKSHRLPRRDFIDEQGRQHPCCNQCRATDALRRAERQQLTELKRLAQLEELARLEQQQDSE
jgi:hypothetical protein